MKILQIVPRYPPEIDGIGEFALLLREELIRQGVPAFPTLVAKRSEQFTGSMHAVQTLPEHSSSCLFDSLCAEDPSLVILHYVGYGYERRGCPFWLLRGLQDWKKKYPHAKLLCIFHELMASSSPLHSAFWLYPWQRFLVSSLLALSAGALVHTQYFARLLRQLSPPCPIYTQPVFPTFSPLHTDSTETKRQAQLLIFGSPAHRKRIYAATSSCLRQLIDEGRIEEIIDIGAPFESKKYFHTLPVQKLGLLSEQEIVPYLCRSSFGAVEYAAKFLGKSTIFANYAAFGVCPILLGDGERDREPAEYSVGKHFLLGGADASEDAVQTIIQQNDHYALENSLEKYAQLMKKCLLDSQRVFS